MRRPDLPVRYGVGGRLAAAFALLVAAGLAPAPLRADPLPDCALKGASSVMIGGRPALRLSDVARCPASLYEVIPSIQIEGQPMVHFRTGTTEKANCTATGDATVIVEGKPATRLGDVNCQQKP